MSDGIDNTRKSEGNYQNSIKNNKNSSSNIMKSNHSGMMNI